MAHSAPIEEMVEHNIDRTYALLGGRETMRRPARNNMEVHDLLVMGLPAHALLHLIRELSLLARGDVIEKALGISMRTLQRKRKDGADAVLSPDQSNKTWKFAEILSRATGIFGSKDEAEAWMSRPATGLDLRRPIDLMASPAGIEAIEDYLTRMEYGVYT